MIKEYGPPALRALQSDLDVLPADRLPWIAEKHVKYLDDRIHRIDQLTDYLASCDPVAQQRQEFVDFVLGWAHRDKPDLISYMSEYQTRFSAVRSRVEDQCDRIVGDNTLWEKNELAGFWREFALVNEIDSLHGMFLTSGRWYVNVMLPIVRELVDCSLPDDISPASRSDLAYRIARRVITPRFAETQEGDTQVLERRFASLFIPVLQYYDRKLLFLFEIMETLPLPSDYNISAFTADVATHPDQYSQLLSAGIYPPFAWHELFASRKTRRAPRPYEDAVRRLMDAVPTDLRDRAELALECLSVMKEYELNYNNYNYKGRFGLVSKNFYWRTAEVLSSPTKATFLDAILLDRFFDALTILESEFTRTGEHK
jgi:hypothetical protein